MSRDEQGRRIFAVAGDPVAHSLSPRMHNAAIAALGLDAVYVAARTTAEAFPALVRSLLEDGGGLNVTMPFKSDAAALLHWPSDTVKISGSCNTIWGDPDEPEGDNTDIAAIREVASELVEEVPVKLVRLLGTGSTARSAALALAQEWPEAIVQVASRSAHRVKPFLAWAGDHGLHGVMPVEAAGRVDLAIVATPHDAMSADYGVAAIDPVAPPLVLLDLAYAKGGTRVVRTVPAPRRQDGRGVLVAQGAASFRHFFQVEPPIAVMRQAVEDALQ